MADVKSKLIEEINKIDDDALIGQLADLIIQSDQKIVVEFDESQINKIRESKSQIENGESYSHEEVMKMIDK